MKQVILVRMDLKLSKGKMSAQVAHASVEATLRSPKRKVDAWHDEGMKKVVLKVVNLRELLKYQNLAKDNRLVASIITDAGKTHVAPGTKTCMAIGPDDEELIDEITGDLKLVS